MNLLDRLVTSEAAYASHQLSSPRERGTAVQGVLNIKGRSYRLRDLEDALKLAHA